MKKFASLLFVLLPLFSTLSCKKDGGAQAPAEPAVLGVEVKNAQAVYEVPKRQAISIELAVVADPTSAEAYTISLAANPGLVSSYNAAKGTSYKMLPSDAYSFTTTNVMLARYNAKSTTCELKLKGEGCEIGETYVLPVALDAVQGGTNFKAPNEKAAYILFKMTPSQLTGSGTSSDPYVIFDTESFMKINGLLVDDSSVYFKLDDDIDFSGVQFTEENPWTPINSVIDEEAIPVAEKRKIYFDGCNHKIINFKGDGALFGTLVGSVQNLTIENADILCLSGNAGGVLAGNVGTSDAPGEVVLKNVKVINSKIENDYKRTGGIAAWVKGGIVEDCSADCTISGSQQCGGLLGRIDAGAVTNCSTTGSVELVNYYGGGLVGVSVDATIKNCNSSVNLKHTSGNYTRCGGLVGQVDGNTVVEKCYATGNVEGTGHYAGGLVGVVATDVASLTISKCYATGNVTLPTTGNFAHAGGLLGSIEKAGTAKIDNCYATGAIVVRRYSSGFVGSVYNAGAKLTVTNSYSTSDISGIALESACGIALGTRTDGAEVSYSGFVAWNVSNRLFCYPVDFIPVAGNYYGTEGSVSKQAQALGWSTDIWDFSGDLPKLK